MVEEWKDIEGWEGIYQVSNLGRVKSLERKRADGRTYKEIIKKQGLNNKGYPTVFLKANGRYKNCTVHRLVAKAFLLKVEGKEFVDHIDGNPKNCRVDNLRWCTFTENCNFPIAKINQSRGHKGYKFTEERKAYYKVRFAGSGNPNSKAVRCIETGEIFGSGGEVNRLFGGSKDAVQAAIRNYQGRYKGFTWEYVNG